MTGKFMMMIGIPGSTKSTYANMIAEWEDAEVISSDIMREKLFGDVNEQTKNDELFNKMYEYANKLLSGGKNVVFDATNISRKKRTHALQNVIKAKEKIAVYMVTSLEECLMRNRMRNRVVPDDAVIKMYKNLNTPTLGEGYTQIAYMSNTYIGDEISLKVDVTSDFLGYEDFVNRVCDVFPAFNDIYELPQDSSYHSFSVSRHTYYVYDYIKNNYTGERMEEMLLAAIFHDIGKAFCKSFYNYKGEEQRYSNFLYHDNVSSQIAIEQLYNIGYDVEKIQYIADLVQFHMDIMNATDKQKKKLQKLLGQEKYEDLVFFNEADMSAK